MGLINRNPQLQAGEQIRWHGGAARVLGRSINTEVGGTLFVTTLGLLFMPNRLNPLGVKERKSAYRIPSKEISAIDVKERDSRTPYTTGQRRHVRIYRLDGEVDVFLMPHPDETAAEFRSLLHVA